MICIKQHSARYRMHYLCISYDDDGDGGDEEGSDIDDSDEDDSASRPKVEKERSDAS